LEKFEILPELRSIATGGRAEFRLIMTV